MIQQQYHTVPTEPREESAVHDYSYEVRSSQGGNRSANRGRLNAKLEEFSRELKQNASSNKRSKIS